MEDRKDKGRWLIKIIRRRAIVMEDCKNEGRWLWKTVKQKMMIMEDRTRKDDGNGRS